MFLFREKTFAGTIPDDNGVERTAEHMEHEMPGTANAKHSNIPEFDIESIPFVDRILEMGIIAYGEHSYEEWKSLAPDRVYAFDVHVRMERLRRQVTSLNDIPKLLALEGLPLLSPNGNIGRMQWLDVCLDVTLARLTSIRDITFLLVAAVFELDIEDRRVSLRTLKARDEVPEAVRNQLDTLSEAAGHFRFERDIRVHRGIRRGYGEDDHSMMHIASIWEAHGISFANTNNLPYANNPNRTYSLAGRTKEIAEEQLREFIVGAEDVVKSTVAVLQSLSVYFEPRFKEKLSRSKLGLAG